MTDPHGPRPPAAVLNAIADRPPGCRCTFVDHPLLGTVLVWDDCPVHPDPRSREETR